ncbi:RdgB/HAM1 family non-canonical purine NTP pyrophosphatase [Candidatus Woesearchaeota archaeon]|nr:RdgB/HAM1 family non-canonical purine NTP pyrophosphatase [Candidatus Woesearchaeota archaeon]
MKPKLTINFVTSNKNKVKEIKQILEPEIQVNPVLIAYPEMRSDNPEEIARQSAEMLANKLRKNVVVEDSGLFIKALNDFPGTCSAYIHKKIGLNGIIKLMDGIKDRDCTYKSAVAYCEPKKKPISFLGEEKGKIAEGVRGDFGFGHDPIFIPERSGKTYGETKAYAKLKKFRRRAVLKLRDCLLNKLNQKFKY